MSQRYLVLASDPEDEGFRWTLDRALEALLPDLGFKYAFRDDAGEGLVRDVFEARDTRAVVSLVSDFETPARYLMVETGSDAEAERIVRELDGVIPSVSPEDLQREARQSMEDDPGALTRLALGAGPTPDPASLEVIREGLRSDDPTVRYQAAGAASLTGWVEFLPDLEDLRRSDPDDEVRNMAAIAAGACGGES